MILHVVRENERINSISTVYNSSLDELKNLNKHIVDWNNLVPGTKIRVPVVNNDLREKIKDSEPFIQDYFPSEDNKNVNNKDVNNKNDNSNNVNNNKDNNRFSENAQFSGIQQNPQAAQYGQSPDYLIYKGDTPYYIQETHPHYQQPFQQSPQYYPQPPMQYYPPQPIYPQPPIFTPPPMYPPQPPMFSQPYPPMSPCGAGCGQPPSFSYQYQGTRDNNNTNNNNQ